MKSLVWCVWVVVIISTLFHHSQGTMPDPQSYAVDYLDQFYGIGFPSFITPCQLSGNSSYQITCNTDGYVTDIVFSLTSIHNYGVPDPNVTFYLPYLKTFKIKHNSLTVLHPSNILTKFINITTLVTISIPENTYITSIPDFIFINNPNLSIIEFTECTKLVYANLRYGTNLSRIYLESTMLNVSNLGTSTYPRLMNIGIAVTNNDTITITKDKFPALLLFRVIAITTFHASASVVLNIESDSLLQIYLSISFKSLTMDMKGSQINRIDLYGHLSYPTKITNITPFFLGCPNLSIFLSQEILSLYWPSLSLAKLNILYTVDIENSNFTTLPDLPNEVQEVTIANTNMVSFPSPFLNSSKFYTMLNFRNNPQLTGAVPDTFCNTQVFDFTNTIITSIPNCLKCYYKQNIGKLPNTITTPSITNCTISLDSKEFISRDGKVIVITGDGLGWGGLSTSSGLRVVHPQKQFIYTLPVPYQAGSKVLNFSSDDGRSANVTWVSAGINITSSISTQIQNGKVRVIMMGFFGTMFNHTAQFNFKTTYKVNFVGGNAEVIVDQSELHIPNNKLFIKNDYSSLEDDNVIKYLPVFPLFSNVSSSLLSSNITAGSDIIIDGYFHDTYFTTARVTLNDNLNCLIQNTTSTSIKCRIPLNTPIGTTKIQVDVTGFQTPGYYFMVQSSTSPNCQQYNYCSGRGTCSDGGVCICDTGYSGESCQYQNNNGTVFQPNNTNTVASFQANGYQFNFTLVSIQELNIRDEIVDELYTVQWTATTKNNPSNTTINYSLVESDAALTVNASIIFTNQSTTYQFGGTYHSLPANSLKITVMINGWTYQSPLNRLRVVFKTNIEEKIDNCGNPISSLLYDSTRNGLKYLKVIKNGIVFFGSFSDVVVVDNRPVYTVNQVINQTATDNPGQSMIHIGVMLPNCQKCIIDPDFSALVDAGIDSNNGDCTDSSSKSLTKEQIIGIVVGCVGGALIITLGAVFIIHKKYSIVRSGKLLRLVTVK